MPDVLTPNFGTDVLYAIVARGTDSGARALEQQREQEPLFCCFRGRPLRRSNDSRPSLAASSARHESEPNGGPRCNLRRIASCSVGLNGRLTRAFQSCGRSIGQGVKVGRSAPCLVRRADRLFHFHCPARSTKFARSAFRWT
jgi:hypothetical protein